MPRIRSMKPEFFSDEKLARLDPVTRLLFLGLVSMADDAGRLVDVAKVIEAFVFPFEDRSADVHDGVKQLCDIGRIVRGTTGSGQRIIEIVNFTRHQRIDRPNLARALPEIVDYDKVSKPFARPSTKDRRDGGEGSTKVRRNVVERSSKRRRGIVEASSTDRDRDRDRDGDRDGDREGRGGVRRVLEVPRETNSSSLLPTYARVRAREGNGGGGNSNGDTSTATNGTPPPATNMTGPTTTNATGTVTPEPITATTPTDPCEWWPHGETRPTIALALAPLTARQREIWRHRAVGWLHGQGFPRGRAADPRDVADGLLAAAQQAPGPQGIPDRLALKCTVDAERRRLDDARDPAARLPTEGPLAHFERVQRLRAAGVLPPEPVS